MSSQHSPEESADVSNRYMGRGGRSSDTIVTQMIELNWMEWNEAGRVNNEPTKNESIFFLLNNNSNSSRMFFIHWIRNCAKF